MFSGGFHERTKDTTGNFMFRDFWQHRRFEPGLVYAQMPIVRPTLHAHSRCFWEKEKCNICNGEMDLPSDCWTSIDVY